MTSSNSSSSSSSRRPRLARLLCNCEGPARLGGADRNRRMEQMGRRYRFGIMAGGRNNAHPYASTSDARSRHGSALFVQWQVLEPSGSPSPASPLDAGLELERVLAQRQPLGLWGWERALLSAKSRPPQQQTEKKKNKEPQQHQANAPPQQHHREHGHGSTTEKNKEPHQHYGEHTAAAEEEKRATLAPWRTQSRISTTENAPPQQHYGEHTAAAPRRTKSSSSTTENTRLQQHQGCLSQSDGDETVQLYTLAQGKEAPEWPSKEMKQHYESRREKFQSYRNPSP
ncbi:hypothetical protein B0T26DRAFT_876270 [Lasiosphaeria miniovina]|uniref:Uncharacterized protein n=1 Tax=Lasiosphaeria miniovina TaxID=1954250 RepID=A0AA39ZT67_9PEZI|nr:uncharacterized protein B0T26DRAFT_876270 [Lasiosphaeria miniovina]KAK0703167.1 hypothetical protein B0T26DRAFT_876270 [Lasiosphaeria miniovina]